MSRTLVTYRLEDSIAVVQMDDGKANVMSEAMLGALDEALDRAEADRAVVVLCGRERIFSGGYDLSLFQQETEEIRRTLLAGGRLVERMLGFPRPIVAACTGHAIAQGAFVLLAADVRIGAEGGFKIGLNEVAIGLTMPHYGVEIARFRLAPPWFDHATTTGRLYGPNEARTAGFLHSTVAPTEVVGAALQEARILASIDPNAHVGTKERARGGALAAIRRGIEVELVGS